MSKIVLDLPSDVPSLGFPEYADALADIVVKSDARFAIGIFGDWGSGKTTLMRAIRARLPATAAICVDFSAWRYEKEEHLIVPLLDAVRAARTPLARVSQTPGQLWRVSPLV